MNFTYPYFLYGILFTAIPIFIHLINKIRKKNLNFPIIFFFQQEIIKLNNRIKLRDIFLLLLRILIILILALLLAQPNFTQTEEKGDEKEVIPDVYLIILDNSYSMNYFDRGKTLFEQAVENVRLFLEKLPKEDKVALIMTNSSATDNMEFLSNKEIILQKLDLATIDDEISNFGGKIDNYISLLEAEKGDKKNIVIFSDFQKYDWENLNFETSGNILINQIGEKKRENYALLKSIISNRVFFSNEKIPIKLIVGNYTEEENEIVVNLHQDDKLLVQKKVHINNLDEEIIEMNVQLKPSKQDIALRATLNLDKYEYDNEIHFNLVCKEKLDVLILENTNNDILEQSLINSLSTKEKRKNYTVQYDLNQVDARKNYDFIIINSVSNLQEQYYSTVSKHIRSNKPVLFIFDKEDIPKLEGLLSVFRLDDSIKIQKKMQETKYLSFNDKLEKGNRFYESIGKNIENNYSKDYIQTSFNEFQYKSIIKYQNGGTFLLQGKSSENNIFVITSSLSIDKSNLLADIDFPLLINNVINEGIINKYIQNKTLLELKKDYLIKQGISLSLMDNEIRKIFIGADYFFLKKEDLLKTQNKTIETIIKKDNLDLKLIFYLLLLFVLIEYFISNMVIRFKKDELT